MKSLTLGFFIIISVLIGVVIGFIIMELNSRYSHNPEEIYSTDNITEYDLGIPLETWQPESIYITGDNMTIYITGDNNTVINAGENK